MYQCYMGNYDVLNYWEQSFLQRMRALYKFHGLPEAGPGQIGWDYDAFLYQLLRMGYAVMEIGTPAAMDGGVFIE